MKKLLALLSISLVVIIASAQHPVFVHNRAPYVNPTGNKFPIVGWNVSNKQSSGNNFNYLTMVDAGFNVVYSSTFIPGPTTLSQNIFDICHSAGIKMMLNLSTMDDSDKLSNIANLNNPSFQYRSDIAALNISMQPKPTDFIGLCNFLDSTYNTAPDSTLFFIEIPGNTDSEGYPVSPELLGSLCYDCYAEVFMKVVKPQFVSFRNLGFLDPEALQNNDTVINRNYYANLEVIRKFTEKTQMPFWAYIASTVPANYPEPTRAMLSLQAFSAIAYGAKGLQYYSYSATGYSNRHGGLVTTAGIPTQLLSDAGYINRDIQANASIYLRMNVQDIWHMGHIVTNESGDTIGYSNPPGTVRFEQSMLPDKIIRVSPDTLDCFLSHSTIGSTHYLLIINKNLTQTAQLSITTQPDVMPMPSVPVPLTGNEEQEDDIQSGIVLPQRPRKITLAPGGHYGLVWDEDDDSNEAVR